MTAPTLHLVAAAAIGLVSGFALGVPYFASVWWSTRLFVTGSAGRAVVLQVGRVGVALAVLTLLARLSFVALLSGALGFLVARALLLRRLGDLQ
jgi:F1F0 ATPase subunit 2